MSQFGNVARINNYYNNIEARADWQAQVNRAWKMGQQALIAKHAPKDGDGWRKLDKRMVAMRDALDAVEQAATLSPEAYAEAQAAAGDVAEAVEERGQ